MEVIVVKEKAARIRDVHDLKRGHAPWRRYDLIDKSEVAVVSVEGCVIEWCWFVSALVRALEKRTGMPTPLILQRHTPLVVVIGHNQHSTRLE